MNFLTRLAKLESLAASRTAEDAKNGPMTDDDILVSFGLLGFEITAAICNLELMQEGHQPGSDEYTLLGQLANDLRNPAIEFSGHGGKLELARKCTNDLCEALGVDSRQTMPTEVFEERVCKLNNIPQKRGI